MIEKYGDLFDTTATYLAQGVNVKGVMGAGIAKQFKSYFPNMFDEYKRSCDNGELEPGGFQAVPLSRIIVVNLASQEKPGADARYHWLFESLMRFAQIASKPHLLEAYGGTIAIPEIGCGIGGLEWHRVKYMLECIEKMYPGIEFEVWHYAPKEKSEEATSTSSR